MSITRLSKKAFAIVAECPNEKKPYGITVDPISEKEFKFVWGFRISRESASREGFDKKKVHGSIQYDVNYKGCPYCGSKSFYICGKCGTVVCYHGEKEVTCPVCGYHSGGQEANEFDLSGGGY